MSWERRGSETHATKVLLDKINEIAEAIKASNGKTENEIVSDQKVKNALDTFQTLLDQAKQNELSRTSGKKPGGGL
ncbi:MAG: hypothetical protein ACYCQI_02165 [Gammaproteobacteria bacterium]